MPSTARLPGEGIRFPRQLVAGPAVQTNRQCCHRSTRAETRRGMPPLTQGEVLMFKLKRSIGWNFPANDDGQENGLNDPGIETFKDHPLSSLAREVLQNSSDAADGSNKPVQVHFERL